MEEENIKGQWFVVHTLSGQEGRVRDAILRQIELVESQIPVYEVNIPTEKVSEVKRGKKSTTTRKFFPGYILVRMDLYDQDAGIINEKVWYFIRNVQGVIGFVGDASNPIPLSDTEVDNLFRQSREEERVKPKVLYEIGEVLRIKDGAFENLEGTVEEIDNGRGKLKLMVSIFGRSTPVELEFWQVEREV